MKAAHVLATAAVLAAAGVVISLVLAFQPSPEAGAGGLGAVSPAAGTRAIAPPTSGSSATAGSLTLAAGPAIATRPPAAPSTPTASAGAPLAGRIKPGVTYQGVATEYSAGNGDGACLFGPASNLMIAAMNYTDYDTASACGDYVMVRAAAGGAPSRSSATAIR